MFPRNVPNGAGRNGVPERSERLSPGSRPASRATEIEVAGSRRKIHFLKRSKNHLWPRSIGLRRRRRPLPHLLLHRPLARGRAPAAAPLIASLYDYDTGAFDLAHLPLAARHNLQTSLKPSSPSSPAAGAPLHQTTTDAALDHALDQASALSTSACAPTAALTRSCTSTPLPRPRRLLHHLLHPSPPRHPPRSPPSPHISPATAFHACHTTAKDGRPPAPISAPSAPDTSGKHAPYTHPFA